MSRRTSASWGTTRSARAFLAASGVVLVAALAGCSSGGSLLTNPAPALNSAAADTQAPANAPQSDTTDSTDSPETTSTRQDEQPAFHFESGDVVLGDFVYEDVKGNIFNPCEEISAEEFARIGFQTEGENRRSETKDLNSCFLTLPGDKSGFNFAVMGASANLLMTVEQGGVVETGVSDLIQGVYTYGPIGLDDDICYAGVDTVRGQLVAVVGMGGVSGVHEHEKLCKASVDILEALYRL